MAAEIFDSRGEGETHETRGGEAGCCLSESWGSLGILLLRGSVLQAINAKLIKKPPFLKHLLCA